MSTSPPPGDADQGTVIGGPLPEQQPGSVAAGASVSCFACRAALEADSRYCQACGAERGSSQAAPDAGLAPAEQKRSPAWLPLLNIVWLVLMVVALLALFSFLFGPGL